MNRSRHSRAGAAFCIATPPAGSTVLYSTGSRTSAREAVSDAGFRAAETTAKPVGPSGTGG
jgi:hypothetical protein